jgi:hypothetical protein
MKLHQSMGNQALQRMLSPNAPAQLDEGPELEEEELQLKADSTAQLDEGPELEEEELQLKADSTAQLDEGPELEEEELQLKADSTAQLDEGPELEEEELQLKADSTAQLDEGPELEEEELQMKADPVQRKGKLPEGLQMKMENAMGADFSGVNVQESSKASDIGALAYTQGNDIHFAPGQYNPDSSSGQELIGHELTHVVQQREGRVQPTTESKGIPINDDPGLEQEADSIGKKAASQPEIEL